MTSSDSSRPDWWVAPRADRTGALALPEPVYERYRDPAGYDPGDELTAAVNVALLLGQPLLITGDPGCGKTSLAFWLATQMGLKGPLVHVVKSTTTGKELLYSFDELSRFRDAQNQTPPRPHQDYLELNALGQAIVFSAAPRKNLKRSTATHTETATVGPGASASASMPLEGHAGPLMSGHAAAIQAPERHQDLYQGPFPKMRRQLVLIDEFDKAPRDTPNDLLTEIERMAFRIPELGVTVEGDKANRPVLVITSNSEKTLPEPFLRRCVYYHIPPPDAKRRLDIIARRQVPFARRKGQYQQAMDLFEAKRASLGRRPGTAELLAWLDILDHVLSPDGSIFSQSEALKTSFTALAKTREDLEIAKRFAQAEATTSTAG